MPPVSRYIPHQGAARVRAARALAQLLALARWQWRRQPGVCRRGVRPYPR